MYTASVGMRAFQQKLEGIANNMTNVDTVGFKRGNYNFTDILLAHLPEENELKLAGRLTPLGLDIGGGAKVSAEWDFTQGKAIVTNNELDFMLSGKAFFQIAPIDDTGTPLTNKLFFTRQGDFNFRLIDGRKYLVTNQGFAVLNTNGEPINIAGDSKINITKDGRVYEVTGNGEQQELGYLALAELTSPNILEEVGNGLYQIPSLLNNSTVPLYQILDMTDPVTKEKVTITQGSLEGSNVDLVQEMTDLLKVERGYQLQARAFSYAENMLGLTVNLRG